MKKILLVCIGFLLTNLVQAQSTLPDVTVKNLKGESVAFKNLVKPGRVTVVSFWATWCVPCKKEINNLAEQMPDWKKELDFDLVAVSIDDTRNVAKVKSYVNGQKWDFNTFIDANQDLKHALNFQTIPYTIVIDKQGNIVDSHAGYVEGDEFLLKEKVKQILAAK